MALTNQLAEGGQTAASAQISSAVYRHPLQRRVAELIETISADMYEREEIIAVALLGALCGQNTFLYGPPGTAKSLISRRVASAFQAPAYFEYLMNRFSTPEEVFGPVSIRALKEDIYTRKTKHYLPTAEFAFLDEIWKASPAILNTLLQIINERIFRNGDEIQNAPLKALISASNETPESDQGLEALYDRFIIRLSVEPIVEANNFNRLLVNKPNQSNITVADDLLVKADEWKQWGKAIHTVKISPETLHIVHLIRNAIAGADELREVYISDRRWQRAAILMKASAFFNGRDATNHSDALILQYCLWTLAENREPIQKIVFTAVKSTGFSLDLNLQKYDAEKEALEREITNELFYTADVYDTRKIGERDFYYSLATFPLCYPDKVIGLYIPTSKTKESEEFHPVNKEGLELTKFKCQFDGQGTCVISTFESWVGVEKFAFTPDVLFHRGDKRHDVNQRLITSLVDSVIHIRGKLMALLDDIDTRLQTYEQELYSPFARSEQTQMAIQGITEQISRIKLRIKDCERLEALCQ
ncbi:MAG: ATPase [Gammaproteobacteria bacterium]|nr:MAG: ATPase [Gammaproteobacteria bacterium]